MAGLSSFDIDIAKALRGELERQRTGLEMIASENYCSLAVMEAQGSILTNKYSEGYPGKRYYGGNEFADVCENLAIERAKKLFGAAHANVQPHAGSQANMAAYFAMLPIGGKIMGLALSEGGHLTHGSPVNFSGKLYKIIPYHVDKESELLDYGAIRKLAESEKPDVILAGYTAYPRTIDFAEFAKIATDVGAKLIVDMAHIAGLIAGKVHPDPVPYADVITTTTHKTLRGPRGAMILCKAEYAQAIDKAVFPGMQGGPLDHVIAAKAVCFKEAMQPEFRRYAEQIVKNSKALAEGLMEGGLRLVSGGTDTHLVLVDLRSKNLTGKEAQTALELAGITINKNTIPYDEKSPFITSGIRVGTPALTTRGMKEDELKAVAGMLVRVLDAPNDEAVRSKVKSEILELCRHFPLYPELG
ncbi:MAG: serine hydroxymethyltransferase [Candidatus Burarchaeum sp.]|nr:serine hydroxymethyltransferase [Candidatus Burarchaeum sp.]MDO8340340.1 serine hydroxymethyltransferase [Candidatus Burarchaeum sp.]